MAEHELNKIVDDDGEVFNLRDSTKQPTADRVTAWGSTPSDTKYPSEKLVKDSLDGKQATLAFDGTYNASTNKAATVSTVTNAIGGLDVSSAGGAGKYISAISETDGKISATATTMDTTPTASSTKAVTSGGIRTSLDGKISYGAKLIDTNPFGGTHLYLNYICNAMYSMDKRYFVTATIHNKIDGDVEYPRVKPGAVTTDDVYYEDGPIYSTCTAAQVRTLFNGNYDETNGISIPSGKYLKVHIQFSNEEGWSPSSGSLQKGYPYGFYFLSFYYNWIPNSAQWRCYNRYQSQGLGWKLGNFSYYAGSAASTSSVILRGSDEGNYQRSCIEILVFTKDNIQAMLTQIDWALTRPRLSVHFPFFTNFDTQTSYVNWKFKHNDGPNSTSVIELDVDNETIKSKNLELVNALPVGSGGTGGTTQKAAEYNICNPDEVSATPSGDSYVVFSRTDTASTTNGRFQKLKLSYVWTWIKGLLSSESGVNISGSSASCTGNAETATAAQSGSALETAINGKAPTSHASSATTYGIGTTSNYGHVKLATGDMNGATHADGVAVSKNHTHSQYLTSHQDISGKLNKDASNAITGSGTGTAPTLLEGLGIGTSKISSGDVFIPTTNAEGATDGKWFKRKLANIAYGITGYGLGSIQVTNADYSAQVGMSYGDFYNSSTPIYGWKIGTTSVNVSSGWATCNLKAIVVITDWSGTDDYASTDFIGTLTITDRMSAATLSTDSWKYIGRLTSLQPQRTNSSSRGWALYCKGNSSTYSHEWYIGRRGSTASQMNGEIKYSKITILSLFESNWTRAMERVNSAMTFNSSNYDDWWAQYVNVALPAETYSVGSASLPVYVDSNKEIKPIERSIILYDNRPNQTYKDPYFSARIDDNTFCNIEAWNNSGTIKCGLYARNGSGTTAGFISYMESNGYLHFGDDQANSWSGRSGNGSSGSQKHYFNGAEICGSSLRNSGTSHYRLYFGKMTPGTDNGAKHFCGLLEVNTIATTSGAVRGTGFVAIVKIDARNYNEFNVNMSILSNNGWNLTGLRPTLVVKEEGDERLFAIGFTNASGTLQAFQYTRFNLTQIGYSLGFTYDRWFSTASSKGSDEYFWPATLGDAENAVSANELRIPYGSGSVYLQIGVSGSGNYLELGTNMADGVMVNYAGEASTAAVAGRLGTASVGSSDNPIYLNNGVPTACNWWVS